MVRYLSLLLFIGLVWGQSELEHDDAGTYHNLGNAYYNQGNYTKAIESYKKAIELKPDYGHNYFLLGLTEGKAGNKERKISNYKNAARLGHLFSQDWLKENGYDWKTTIVLQNAIIYLLNGERIDGDIVEIVAADKYIVVRTESLERRISYAYIDYVRHNNKGLADYLQAAANKPEPKPVDVPKPSHRIPKEKNTNKHNYYFGFFDYSIIPTELRLSDLLETRFYWLQYKYAINHTLDYSLKKGLFGSTDEQIDDWVYSHNFGIRKNISERISINLWYNLVYDIDMSEYKGDDEGWVSEFGHDTKQDGNLPRYFELILQYESKRLLSFGLRLKLGVRLLNTEFSGGTEDLLNLALHQNEVNNMLNRYFLSFSYTGLEFSF